MIYVELLCTSLWSKFLKLSTTITMINFGLIEIHEVQSIKNEYSILS